MNEDRPTPAQRDRVVLILDCLIWPLWAFLCWHLIGFTLEAFFG